MVDLFVKVFIPFFYVFFFCFLSEFSLYSVADDNAPSKQLVFSEESKPLAVAVAVAEHVSGATAASSSTRM